jgi:hypothetical protein
VVVFELILFFTVDEKTIWDNRKDFEAAIAEAGGVDGKWGAKASVKCITAENIAYVFC